MIISTLVSVLEQDPINTYNGCVQELRCHWAKIQSKMKKIAAANQGQFQETFLKPKRYFERGAEIISNISHWVPFVINVFMKHISKIPLREWMSGLRRQENWPLFYLTFANFMLILKTYLMFQKHKKRMYDIGFISKEFLFNAFMSRQIHKDTSFDKTLEKNLRKLAQYDRAIA